MSVAGVIGALGLASRALDTIRELKDERHDKRGFTKKQSDSVAKIVGEARAAIDETQTQIQRQMAGDPTDELMELLKGDHLSPLAKKALGCEVAVTLARRL